MSDHPLIPTRCLICLIIDSESSYPGQVIQCVDGCLGSAGIPLLDFEKWAGAGET